MARSFGNFMLFHLIPTCAELRIPLVPHDTILHNSHKHFSFFNTVAVIYCLSELMFIYSSVINAEVKLHVSLDLEK